jgi:hypothetical protein
MRSSLLVQVWMPKSDHQLVLLTYKQYRTNTSHNQAAHRDYLAFGQDVNAYNVKLISEF